MDFPKKPLHLSIIALSSLTNQPDHQPLGAHQALKNDWTFCFFCLYCCNLPLIIIICRTLRRRILNQRRCRSNNIRKDLECKAPDFDYIVFRLRKLS